MKPEIVGERVIQLMKINNMEEIELAKKMNLSLVALQRKLRGEEEFWLNEIELLAKIFKLSNDKCSELCFEEVFEY